MNHLLYAGRAMLFALPVPWTVFVEGLTLCAVRRVSVRVVLQFFTSFSHTLLSPAQSITDAIGDILTGDPNHLYLNRIRVRQVGEKIQVDFYPVSPIPRGNQAGITTTTVFELYLDLETTR